MKDLIFEEQLSEREINGRDAWFAKTSGEKDGLPIILILAIIETDQSPLPKHKALHIIQIWCPEEIYEKHMDQMENIINSVEIVD